MAGRHRPFIFVLAGVNGAGKSSVGGNVLAEHKLTWFNPDSYARELMARLGLTLEEANAAAWQFGREQLEEAIAKGKNFAFETTLGANTIPRLLAQASATHDVVMWFCGLESAELHIQRVKARVASGGHGIPEAKIRERWDGSRRNLIRLLPHLAHLQVFDNSAQAARGQPIPVPVLLLEMVNGKMLSPDPADVHELAKIPEWAMAVVEAAIRLQQLP
ncbi:MAG: AAA family ATPase [Steroidobacteraceae bacterium]